MTGVTSFMASASHGKVEIADLGLVLGTDASYKLNNGWTAIDFARLQGQQGAEKCFLSINNSRWDYSMNFYDLAQEEK